MNVVATIAALAPARKCLNVWVCVCVCGCICVSFWADDEEDGEEEAEEDSLFVLPFLKSEYTPNCSMLYDIHKYVADKLPFHRAQNPSSSTIVCRDCHKYRYFASTPCCIWNRIFRTSSGAVSVLAG